MDQGDSVRIEQLIRRKKGRPGEEIEVLLSDASSFFAALRSWQNRPFHEGDQLTRQAIESLRTESAAISTRARALSLLDRADHSAFLLRQKLISRGHDAHVVDEVLTALIGEGLLDDTRFAASWVRDRLRRHPEGRPVLVAGLRQRGVTAEVAESAVSAVLADDQYDIDQTIRTLAERYLRSGTASANSVAASRFQECAGSLPRSPAQSWTAGRSSHPHPVGVVQPLRLCGHPLCPPATDVDPGLIVFFHP